MLQSLSADDDGLSRRHRRLRLKFLHRPHYRLPLHEALEAAHAHAPALPPRSTHTVRHHWSLSDSAYNLTLHTTPVLRQTACCARHHHGSTPSGGSKAVDEITPCQHRRMGPDITVVQIGTHVAMACPNTARRTTTYEASRNADDTISWSRGGAHGDSCLNTFVT